MIKDTKTLGTRFEPGDMVYGRPVVEGKILTRRKGVVLDEWTGEGTGAVVWWYGMGHASESGTNTTLMFHDELSYAGDIFETSLATVRRLWRDCANYPRARFARSMMRRHMIRMQTLGARQPVK